MANKTICALTYGDTHVFTLPFRTCSTAAGTAAKTVDVQDGKFSLETGARVCVKFSNTNTTANPTLNVSGTGAKNIWYSGANISTSYLTGGRIYEFIYNGTQWELIGEKNTNTTYSVATTSKNGLMSAADKTKLDGLSSDSSGGMELIQWEWSGTGRFGGTTTTNYSFSKALKWVHVSTLLELGVRYHELFPARFKTSSFDYTWHSRIVTPGTTQYFKYQEVRTLDEIELPFEDDDSLVVSVSLSTDGKTVSVSYNNDSDYEYLLHGFGVY